MSKIRILIVDDHVMVCEALQELLNLQEDMHVVGQAHDAEQAFSLAKFLQPDIVLMDIEMTGQSDAGVVATQRITSQYPQIHVIMLTIHSEDAVLLAAIKAGARGYALKHSDSTCLLETIRAVQQGDARMDSGMAVKVLEEFRKLSSQREFPDLEYIHLTDREKDILSLVAQGASNNEIAHKLGITIKTVSNRLTIIFDKLHVNNRTQAARYASKLGISSADREDSDLERK